MAGDCHTGQCYRNRPYRNVTLPTCATAVSCTIDKQRYTFFARDMVYSSNTQIKKFKLTHTLGNRDSSVSIVIRLSDGRYEVRFQADATDLSLLRNVQAVSAAQQTSHLMDTKRQSDRGVKLFVRLHLVPMFPRLVRLTNMSLVDTYHVVGTVHL